MSEPSHTPSSTPPQWMVVATTYNEIEAHIIVGRLESHGIGAWMQQEPFGSAMGITVGTFGIIRVVVNAEDYDTATAILEQSPDQLPDETDRVIYDEDDEADE